MYATEGCFKEMQELIQSRVLSDSDNTEVNHIWGLN